jgi:hypothetical protein
MTSKQFHDTVIERLTAIEANLIPKETLAGFMRSFEILEKSLMGNGQPGRCQQQETALQDILVRVETVERKQAWYSGVTFGISVASSFLSRLIFPHKGG